MGRGTLCGLKTSWVDDLTMSQLSWDDGARPSERGSNGFYTISSLERRFIFRRGFPDSLNEDGDHRQQIGVNRVVTGAIHSVAEHSGVYRIAENVDGTAEVHILAYASDLLGHLETLNQSGPPWNHFFQNRLADSRRQKSAFADHGSNQ